MSAREQLSGNQDALQTLKILVVGPKGLKEAVHKAVTFIGDYWNFLELVELPDRLDAPLVEIEQQVQIDVNGKAP